MKWIKVTSHLYKTDLGHQIRKVNETYNVFLGDRFIGSSDDKEKVKQLLLIKQPEQQSAEDWLEDYCKEPDSK